MYWCTMSKQCKALPSSVIICSTATLEILLVLSPLRAMLGEEVDTTVTTLPLPAEEGTATSPLLAMLGEEVETSVTTLPAGEDVAAVPVQRAFLQSPSQFNLSIFEKSSSTAGFCP